MTRPAWLARLGRRTARLLAAGLVLGVFGLLAMTVLAVVTVEHTSQPQFCNSCHIMEPYYDSWRHSSHADVSCIECHYEPGAVETFEGKFKALSQLAKYVTRTAGTKPWAEVSDASCMRSGCHSVRMLEGPIAFGRVKFDHRHHLLESRRGRRLRCVSCHSQIVQGEHVTVTESVCFMCHFMPGVDQAQVRDLGDCTVCHGPPEGTVEVAGRPFSHEEYIRRGVDCRECHEPVVEGDGTVRRERCHSCHGEVGHIERFGETAFLHQKHVTDHKVECFECHDEIRHGLLPLHEVIQPPAEGCGTCHVSPHDGAGMLYSGTGAFGVEDRPSRMYETRVVCEACHTGRAGLRRHGDDVTGSPGDGGGVGHGLAAAVAVAGEVDCIHCHGVGFEGMLGRWQEAVASELKRLEPALEALAADVTADTDPERRRLYEEARHNVELVRVDGSFGAHNVDYALDALAAAAERLERAGQAAAPSESAFRSEHGCSTCHLGIEAAAVATASGRSFDHGEHLARGLDCQVCHALEPPDSASHGALAAPADCNSCHHRESEEWDVWECGTCHADQVALAGASLASAAVSGHAVFEDKECTECHGEPPDLYIPSPEQCALCHDDGFAGLIATWQGAVGQALEQVEPRLGALEEALATAPDAEVRGLLRAARRDVQRVRDEGSLGVHNAVYALDVLAAAAARADQAFEQLGQPVEPLARSFPFRSQHGCSTCHLGVEQAPATIEDGRAFSHAGHLARGLDCDTCHVLEPQGEDGHGAPSFPRADCASCHHQETDEWDAWDCGACHADQEALMRGTLEGLLDEAPVTFVDKECTECHGEPPDLYLPQPSQCNLCHGEGYDALPAEWQAATRGLLERVEDALEAAQAAGADEATLRAARERLAPVRADGTLGIHNPELARTLLEAALERLAR